MAQRRRGFMVALFGLYGILAVYFPTIPDADDGHQGGLVIHLVNHPPVTLTNAVKVAVSQFGATGRPLLEGQTLDLGHDPPQVLPWHGSKVFFGALFDLNLI